MARRAAATIPVQNVRVLARQLRPAVAKNRQRAERLIGDVQKRKSRISEDFYQIGLALKELTRPALHHAAGHTSFRELLRARKLMSHATAYKLIAVVDHYPKAQARKIGFAKAYALTRFVAATPADDLAATVANQNPTIGRTPLADMSVRQLNAATARIRRAATNRPTDPEAKAARKAARTLQRTLRKAGATSAKTQAIRIEGHWHLRTDMRLEDAEHWT